MYVVLRCDLIIIAWQSNILLASSTGDLPHGNLLWDWLLLQPIAVISGEAKLLICSRNCLSYKMDIQIFKLESALLMVVPRDHLGPRKHVLDGMHILAHPGEYDWTVHMQRHCVLLSDYLDHFLLLNCIAVLTVHTVYCYRQSSVVSLFVCQSVTLVSPAKTDEPIKMPLGLKIWGPRESCVRWGTDPIMGRGNFQRGGERASYWKA